MRVGDGQLHAQPIRAEALKRARNHLWQVQNDLSGGVEAASTIEFHFATDPARDVALPDLPFQWRARRIDARTACDIDLHVDRDHVIAVIVFQRDVKRITRRRRRAEHDQLIAL